MKVYAISDLHVGYEKNAKALQSITDHPEDYLILAGDLGERLSELRLVFETLRNKFKRLIWVPGNHELWSVPDESAALGGQDKYLELVKICREYGVATPEDPFERIKVAEKTYVLAPLFLLYDYSFRPSTVSREQVLGWAEEEGVYCSDEHFLKTQPFPSIVEWCDSRIKYSMQRLQEIPKDLPIVLINHYPLRQELVRLFRVPRFAPWCGTKQTEEWHRLFNVHAVVSGHLHMRATDWVDGVRFEEVSVGYPRQWKNEESWDYYLREILPAPESGPPSTGVLSWTYPGRRS